MTIPFRHVDAFTDAAFDIVSRVFAPAIGIPKDPATGSAHCALGPHWEQVIACVSAASCWSDCRAARSLRSTSAALHSGLGFGVAGAVGSLVGWNVDRPTLVTKGQLRGVGTATPGVTRFEAFADQHVWVGRVVNTPHQASDWHVHPGHDTYAHCTRGRFFVEFGPGGSERIEIAPGDFALIPKGVVHREGNAGAEETDGIVVRVGQGPVTVNLDGPET